MKYFISISYDGSKFFGFQRLRNDNSVQGCLEKALTKIDKMPVTVKGAGRTDRGVHALDQGVSFELKNDIPPERLVNAINSLLPSSIRVNSANLVDDDFHARFRVIKKTYTYVINMGKFNPILDNYLYNYNRELDVKKIKKAAKMLVGAHSYRNFTAGTRDNYDSIIYKIEVKKDQDNLIIKFVGKSFYRYMVRNLVGFLIAVSENKITYDEITKYFLDENINIHYTTVPANGLYLTKIEY